MADAAASAFAHMGDAFAPCNSNSGFMGGGMGAAHSAAMARVHSQHTVAMGGQGGGMAGGHRRSNSVDSMGMDEMLSTTDNMGLDEILSMPWLAQHHDHAVARPAPRPVPRPGSPSTNAMLSMPWLAQHHDHVHMLPTTSSSSSSLGTGMSPPSSNMLQGLAGDQWAAQGQSNAHSSGPPLSGDQWAAQAQSKLWTFSN